MAVLVDGSKDVVERRVRERAGAVVDPDLLARAWTARAALAGGMRYGLGFWRAATGPGVVLEGYDAGVSFRSVHDPTGETTHTVIGSWSDAAWPLARLLDEVVPARD